MRTARLYTAPWCEPCKALKPTFTALMNELGISFEVVDVNEDPQRARQEKVMSVPTLIVTDGYRIIGRASGPLTREQIIKVVEGEQ